MPTCAICNSFIKDRKSFIVHLKLLHRFNKNSRFNCGEIKCHRHFPNLNSYLKHLNNHNGTTINSHKIHEKIEIDVELPTKGNIEIATSQKNNFVDSTIIHDKKEKVSKEDTTHFRNGCQNLLIELFCKLYSHHTFTRKDVQTILTFVLGFIREPLSNLKTILLNFLGSSKILEDSKYMLDCFDILIEVFTSFNSEHLRFKYLRETGNFIEPSAVKLGETLEMQKTMSIKNIHYQFIPPSQVLKKFFELPNVLDETMSYMKTLQENVNNSYTNIIQCPYWKEKISKYNLNESTMPILVYFDDYEVGNPLGSHAGIHKLGAIYFSVGTVPLFFQSQLENIFLSVLYHSADLRTYGPKALFSKLINDFNNIEVHGINVVVRGEEHTIHFSVALILGDNLGLHTMFGLTESFSSTFCCRFCKCPKSITRTLYREIPNTLRTKENYEEDLLIENVSLTGIKKPCVWNDLSTFHIMENHVVDIMHDIFEGVAVIIMMNLLNQFILKDKFFTLKTLNFKLKNFKFGAEVSNKPPLISEENLRKKKINMSASEMKYFVLYAGLIFGHFVPIENEHWRLYIFLIKILNIVLARSITLEDCTRIDDYVEQLNSIYSLSFSNELTPKLHHLLHYGTVMSKTGPPNNLSCFRYEAKHRNSKLSSYVVASRINITKTLAIKHQLIQCKKFVTGKGFSNDVIIQNGGVQCKINSPEFREFQKNLSKSKIQMEFGHHIIFSNKVTIHKTSYRVDDIILVDHKRKIFGKIVKIAVDEKKTCILLIYHEIMSVYDDHFMANELSLPTKREKIILQSQLVYHKSLTPIQHGSKKYIVTEY